MSESTSTRPARSAKTDARTRLSDVFKSEIKAAELEEVEVQAKAIAEAEAQRAVQEEDRQHVATVKIEDMFTKFKSTTKLHEGLSIVRDIGGGRYEIICLRNINLAALGAEEVGEHVKSSQRCMDLLAAEEKEWKSSKDKVEFLLNNARGKIFRFLNLPIELRFKCYEFMIVAPHRLRSVWKQTVDHDTRLSCISLPVRACCRQVSEETRNFFWKNNFAVTVFNKSFNYMLPTFLANVQKITFEWIGNLNKDRLTFNTFNMCPKLKVLNILLATSISDSYHHRGQYLHKDKASVKRFRKITGFDALSQIRGLDKVTVGKLESVHNTPLAFTDKEVKAFEDFLMSELTKPKARPVVMRDEAPKKGQKKTSKYRGGKRKHCNRGDDDDFTVR